MDIRNFRFNRLFSCLLLTGLAFLMVVRDLDAQRQVAGDSPQECFLKQFKCEQPIFEFPLYCNDGTQFNYRFKSNPSLGFEFSGFFPKKLSEKKGLSFHISDGRITNKYVGEAKMFDVSCDSLSGACEGLWTKEDFVEAFKAVNLAGPVQNITIRKGDKIECISKFSSNAAFSNESDTFNRQYCSFTASDNATGLSGEGFFDPESYGIDADSHFHMNFSGFPVGEEIKGCIPTGGNRFQRVLTFQARKVGETDSDIYGKLRGAEKLLFDEKPLEYSYDLVKQLASEGDNITASSRSLALLNRQIGKEAAVSEAKEVSKQVLANKTAKKENGGKGKKGIKEKRRAKKKRNKRRKRSGLVVAQAFDDTIRKIKDKEKIYNWLSFDPLAGGDIIIAPKCTASGIAKTYGVVSCRPNPNDFRRCSSYVDKLGVEKGGACIEDRDGFSLITSKIRLPSGKYQVCLTGANGFKKLEGLELDNTNSDAEFVFYITNSKIIESKIRDAFNAGEVISENNTFGIFIISKGNGCSSDSRIAAAQL